MYIAQHLSVLERMSSEAAGIAQARRTAAARTLARQAGTRNRSLQRARSFGDRA